MDYRKKLLLIALVLVIALICIMIGISNKNKNIASTNDSENSINTNEVAVDLTSGTGVSRLAKDYTNFTDSEKENIYNMYGYDNVKFTEQGLIVKEVDFADDLEERLYTDIWPDTDLTNSVIKPEFGEIGEIEVGQTYLYILLDDVSEKDLKAYAKQVKKEYSDEIKNENKNIIYKGRNENRSKVTIAFDEGRSIGSIHYDF